jgi:hypothetical protein
VPGSSTPASGGSGRRLPALRPLPTTLPPIPRAPPLTPLVGRIERVRRAPMEAPVDSVIREGVETSGSHSVQLALPAGRRHLGARSRDTIKGLLQDLKTGRPASPGSGEVQEEEHADPWDSFLASQGLRAPAAGGGGGLLPGTQAPASRSVEMPPAGVPRPPSAGPVNVRPLPPSGTSAAAASRELLRPLRGGCATVGVTVAARAAWLDAGDQDDGGFVGPRTPDPSSLESRRPIVAHLRQLKAKQEQPMSARQRFTAVEAFGISGEPQGGAADRGAWVREALDENSSTSSSSESQRGEIRRTPREGKKRRSSVPLQVVFNQDDSVHEIPSQDESVHSQGGEACQLQEAASEAQGRGGGWFSAEPVVPALDVSSDFPAAKRDAVDKLVEAGSPSSLAAPARLSSGGSANSQGSGNSTDSTNRLSPGADPAQEVASPMAHGRVQAAGSLMRSSAQAGTATETPSDNDGAAAPVLRFAPMERASHEPYAVPGVELEEELPSDHEDGPAPVPHSTASAAAAPSRLMEEQVSSSDEDIDREDAMTRVLVPHSTSATTTAPVKRMEEQHSTASAAAAAPSRLVEEEASSSDGESTLSETSPTTEAVVGLMEEEAPSSDEE